MGDARDGGARPCRDRQSQRAPGDLELGLPGGAWLLPVGDDEPGLVEPQGRAVQVECRGRALVDLRPELEQQIGVEMVVAVAQSGLAGGQVQVQRQPFRRDLESAAQGAGAAHQGQVPVLREQMGVDGEVRHLHRGDGQDELEGDLGGQFRDVLGGRGGGRIDLRRMQLRGEPATGEQLLRPATMGRGVRLQFGPYLVEAHDQVGLGLVRGIDHQLDGTVATEVVAAQVHGQGVGLDHQIGPAQQLTGGEHEPSVQAPLAAQFHRGQGGHQQRQEVQVLHRQVDLCIELGQAHEFQPLGRGQGEGWDLDPARDRCGVGHRLGWADRQGGQRQVEGPTGQGQTAGLGLHAQAAADRAGQATADVRDPEGVFALEVEVVDLQRQRAAGVCRRRRGAGLGVAVADHRIELGQAVMVGVVPRARARAQAQVDVRQVQVVHPDLATQQRQQRHGGPDAPGIDLPLLGRGLSIGRDAGQLEPQRVQAPGIAPGDLELLWLQRVQEGAGRRQIQRRIDGGQVECHQQ